MSNSLKFFHLLKFKIRSFFGMDSTLNFKKFSIRLPPGHRLPLYQKIHPRYDRFLPHLVSGVDSKSIVIDVGANCGDTLAAMVDSNASLNYICIEPDPDFYKKLKENIDRIKKAYPLLGVVTDSSIVGRDVSNVSLEGEGGTRHAVVGGGVHQAEHLDVLVPSTEYSSVGLIKIDVDGFDYDVLNSAQAIILARRPILFFECHFQLDSQRHEFELSINWLWGVGYENWALFDNYGGLILRTDRVGDILQLISYVNRQNTGAYTRTMYYFDILAFGDGDSEVVNRLLDVY